MQVLVYVRGKEVKRAELMSYITAQQCGVQEGLFRITIPAQLYYHSHVC